MCMWNELWNELDKKLVEMDRTGDLIIAGGPPPTMDRDFIVSHGTIAMVCLPQGCTYDPGFVGKTGWSWCTGCTGCQAAVTTG